MLTVARFTYLWQTAHRLATSDPDPVANRHLLSAAPTGLTNNFLCMTHHPSAITHGYESPNEQTHTAITTQLLLAHQVISHIQEFDLVRSLIKDLVLPTDMAVSSTHLALTTSAQQLTTVKHLSSFPLHGVTCTLLAMVLAKGKPFKVGSPETSLGQDV